ncbi:MAG TPA: thymidine phosphorylase family protein [Gemmatimonadales bacterium]|nr:thymidine phosphorylase family protein [Gemmatimonadales bacterium]
MHRARRLGIDTGQEPVIYLHRESQVCRSEGFESETRVWVSCRDRATLATLNVVTGALLAPDEAGLSDAAWTRLAPQAGEALRVAHQLPLDSFGFVRAKIHGKRLDADSLDAIVRDVAAGLYSDLQIGAFLVACAGGRLNQQEITDLTRAMIGAGTQLHWERDCVMDKHCVGGVPGNRTSLIVVPIAAVAGLLIPKTSSRAITSPAGTADTMETLAPVDLTEPAMRRVVEREGACIVWGGRARLSPADDMFIRVEHPLDLDSAGQMIASVLSKKAAAGATRVVLDVPVGPTAKVRSPGAALRLADGLKATGTAIGLDVLPIITDGSQPVGRGVGPVLEARDVLAVLQGRADAPTDLRERSLLLAGHVLELGGAAPVGTGVALARTILEDGRAWQKFQAICEAQGGMRELPRAAHVGAVPSARAGTVRSIDNRKLARVAKLAGAPRTAVAGLELHAHTGTRVAVGEPLFTVHAATAGMLEYALAYLATAGDIFVVGDPQ